MDTAAGRQAQNTLLLRFFCYFFSVCLTEKLRLEITPSSVEILKSHLLFFSKVLF